MLVLPCGVSVLSVPGVHLTLCSNELEAVPSLYRLCPTLNMHRQRGKAPLLNKQRCLNIDGY